jgi:hypothetical protein
VRTNLRPGPLGIGVIITSWLLVKTHGEDPFPGIFTTTRKHFIAVSKTPGVCGDACVTFVGGSWLAISRGRSARAIENGKISSRLVSQLDFEESGTKGVASQEHPLQGGETLRPIKSIRCRLLPHNFPLKAMAEQGGALDFLRPPFVQSLAKSASAFNTSRI